MAAISKNMKQAEYDSHNIATVVMVTLVIGVLGLFTSFF